jgi:hypothetical protein
MSSWLQLDPQALAERANAASRSAAPPSLAESVVRGCLGFALVSVAGFAPWALAGRQLHRAIGEAGLYGVCALIFIVLSGPVLHRLIIGPGSLPRFYVLFSVAFTGYAIVWIIGWMSLRGHLGSLVGLFGGTFVMGLILATAFDARADLVQIVAALFIFNTVGYFAGGWVEGFVAAMKDPFWFGLAPRKHDRMVVAMLLWGLCYGLGFGAGLGLAFYQCQARARALLKDNPNPLHAP